MVKIKKKNIFIIGAYGMGNSGDEALLHCLLRDLVKYVKNINIIVGSFDKGFTEEYHSSFGVKFVENNERSLFPLEIHKIIKNSDVLVICGSTPFTDKISSGWLYFFLSRIWLAKIYKTKVFIWGSEIGPISKNVNRLLTRLVLNKVDFITVRNKESQLELKKIGVNMPSIKKCADPALTLEINPDKNYLNKMNINNKRPIVCFAPTLWYMYPVKIKIFSRPHHLLWPNDGKKKLRILQKFIAELVDFTVEELDAQPIFINMREQKKSPFINGLYDDNIMTKKIISFTNHKEEIKVLNNVDFKFIKSFLQEVDMLVSMRLHALIFASSACIPLIGFSTDDKIQRFFNQIGQHQNVVDINNLNLENAKTMIRESWMSRRKLENGIKNKVNYLQNQAGYNTYHLIDFLHD